MRQSTENQPPMRVPRRLFRLCLCLLVPVALFAKPDPVQPRAGWFVEWEDERPLSGGNVVGLMIPAADGPIRASNFSAYIPASSLGVVRVNIVSADRRYRAELVYDLPAERRGWVRFQLPDVHLKNLFSLQTCDVAILAWLGADSENPSGYHVLAGWKPGPPIDQLNTVVFFVNSRVPTSILAFRPGKPVSEGDCTELEGEELVAFNQRCERTLAQLAGNVFIRKETARGRDDIPFPILLKPHGASP